MGVWSRVIVVVFGLVAWRLSFLLEPYYLAWPQLLLQPGVLWPPGLARGAAEALAVFALWWTCDSLLYRAARSVDWRESYARTLESYVPAGALSGFALLLLPGVAPIAVSWLLLDGSLWFLSMVFGCILYRRLASARRPGGGSRSTFSVISSHRLAPAGFVILLVAAIFVLAPERRFSQPYDERWGTGDEPRYVRITASLLHDADVDIGNASEHIGQPAELTAFPKGVMRWIPATISTLWEAGTSLVGGKPVGKARHLGGPVLEGRNGGTFYVFLPGLPFLLVPAMAVDSLLMPDRLYITLSTCVMLSALGILMLMHLVEPFVGDRRGAFALGFTLAMTLPFFFYHSQLFTEALAAGCVGLLLFALLSPRLGLVQAIAFAVAEGLLVWLHGKFLPIWGVCLLAYCFRAWREHTRAPIVTVALATPLLAMGLYCLFVFGITGSLMPDALWVVRGYPRGASFVSASTPSGLYYMFLGRSQGLFVYAPLYVLTLLGAVELWRRSKATLGLLLALSLPYILIAASHDQGGAGGWSPPSRYAVPLVPVFGIAIAAWLGPPHKRALRWMVLAVTASASFCMAYGMLAERNFPYDRRAFLASGVVDPSPALGSVVESDSITRRTLYPAFLVAGIGLFVAWERRRWPVRPLPVTFAALGLVVAGGLVAGAAAEAEQWVHPRNHGPVRARPDKPLFLALPDCGSRDPRLEFQGAASVHRLTVTGANFDRELTIPGAQPIDLQVRVAPALHIDRNGRRPLRIVGVALEAGQRPIQIRGVCGR